MLNVNGSDAGENLPSFESRGGVQRLAQVCRRMPVVATEDTVTQWLVELGETLALLSRGLARRSSIDHSEVRSVLLCSLQVSEFAPGVYSRVRHLFRAITGRCEALAVQDHDWRYRRTDQAGAEMTLQFVRHQGIRRLWSVANGAVAGETVSLKTALEEVTLVPFSPPLSEADAMQIEYSLLLIFVRRPGLAQQFSHKIRQLLTVLRVPFKDTKLMEKILEDSEPDYRAWAKLKRRIERRT